MSEDNFEKKLEQFVCKQCNECCRKPGFVYLMEGEEERIAKFLGIDTFDFVNRYCELVDRRRLVLKKHPDEACIFLSEAGCSVHPVKPQQCLDFPVKWRTPASWDYCEGLHVILKEP